MDLYSVVGFSQKLKNIRLQRGYRSQSRLCRELNVSRQTWNLWEKGLRLPSIAHLVEIANTFKVNPLYFLLPDYSITPLTNTAGSPAEAEELIPFVETLLSRKIFKFLEGVRGIPGVHLLLSPGKAGVTRALREYCRLQNISPGEVFFQGTPSRGSLLVVDQAEEWFKTKGAGTFFTYTEKTVILVGKEVKDALKAVNLLDKIKRICYLDVLNYEDFDKIVNAALPAASLEILTLVKAEACLDLVKFYNILLEIRKQEQEKDWELSFESLYELFEKKKEA